MPFDQAAAALRPIVMRMEGMSPHQLAKFLAHAKRLHGNAEHCDPARRHLNRPLIGNADWVRELQLELQIMRVSNLVEEVEALRKLGRKKDARKRVQAGELDPWLPSKAGPMREMIITAHHKYFEMDETGAPLSDKARAAKVQAFCGRAVEWLKANFRDDVVHARVDLDETACHVHAVIFPRVTKTSARRGTQTMLQPSIHPLIQDYEKAQDSIGLAFAGLGLKRGARDAAMRRAIKAAGDRVPAKRRHTPVWRYRGDVMAALQAKAAELEARAIALGVGQAEVVQQKAANATKAAELETLEEDLAQEAAELASQKTDHLVRDTDLVVRQAQVTIREIDAEQAEVQRRLRHEKFLRRQRERHDELASREKDLRIQKAEVSIKERVIDGIATGEIVADDNGGWIVADKVPAEDQSSLKTKVAASRKLLARFTAAFTGIRTAAAEAGRADAERAATSRYAAAMEAADVAARTPLLVMRHVEERLGQLPAAVRETVTGIFQRARTTITNKVRIARDAGEQAKTSDTSKT